MRSARERLNYGVFLSIVLKKAFLLTFQLNLASQNANKNFDFWGSKLHPNFVENAPPKSPAEQSLLEA